MNLRSFLNEKGFLNVQEIVKKTGAIVVNSLDEMDAYPGHHHIIIISDDEENMDSITDSIKSKPPICLIFIMLFICSAIMR